MGNKIGRRRQVVDEKYTRPQGINQIRDIDHKKLRKLILDSKLAPCYPGDDEGCTLDLEECPICFLYFPSLNRSKCCSKGICTECFLQMKPSYSERPSQCPFCKTSNYAVEYRGAKTKEEKGMEQVEEQRVIEARMRIRQQELRDEQGKLCKKEKSSSSSRSLPQAEVEYQDVTGGSHSARCFRYLTQDDEAVSSQGSCSMAISARPSYSRQNREDDFGHLDNIMMMQAIWHSIQEQGGMQISPALSLFSEECFNPNSTFSVEPSPSSSMACTISSLLEPRYTCSPPATMPSNQSSANFPPINWTRDLEQRGWMLMDHGSNLVDAGTSYPSPNTTIDTGPALDVVGMNSVNFEDQFMLTMAVSGARMNSQELMWL